VVSAIFDTNILIDFLNAVPQARLELELYEKRSISIITWMEVLIGADAYLEPATRNFLKGFDVIELDDEIAERAVKLRREGRIKLPDAIIRATAEANAMLLVTRNEKDFAHDLPGVRVPYRL
jgi:predicted nucleic acid-binding protein